MIKRLILCCTLLAAMQTTASAAKMPDEDKVRAAFLYNFSKFIEWPQSSFTNTQGELVIGILGSDHLSDELIPLEGRAVRNHPIKVIYYTSIAEITNCHLLYLGTTDSALIKTALKTLRDKPVVLVSDVENFARNNGIIQLVAVRGRLRFIINQNAAQTKELKINSQLLKLAIEVIEAKQ